MAVSIDVVQTAVGILGNIIPIILFMSPMPTVIQICEKGSVDKYSAAPYLATLINCGVRVLYGLPMVHPNSILVLTINGAGVVIELVYLLLFLRYSDLGKKIRVLLIMLAECIILAVLALLVLTLSHTNKVRSTTVGSIAMFSNILMYASPLAVMKLVIATKSVEYMPLSLSLASLANAFCWTTYALIRFDPYILAPNGLGILFGLAQIVPYAKFYRSSKIQALEMQGKEEMGLAAITISGIDPEKTSSVAQNSHDLCVHGI